jgi:hypothetical protein
MAKLTGGGILGSKNVNVPVRSGPPRTNIVSPASADQIGQTVAFKKDPLPIGTGAQVPLGNQLATNVGKGGPGTGRTTYQCGTQGFHGIYRSTAIPLTTRMRAAIAAIQFEHPKLAVTATMEAGDFADQLERALKRSSEVIEAAPSIEATPIPSDTKSLHVEASNRAENGHKPFVPDRRYRRL